MSLVQIILQALKETVFSFSSERSYREAIIKYDFKIDLPRQNLMQLCFSQLAEWPLYFLLLVVYFDPTQYLWSLQNILGPESRIGTYLLDGRLNVMLIVFGILFFAEFFLHQSYLFIAVIFYFLAKSDLHIHLALAGLLAVFFAKSCYWLSLSMQLQSRTKMIWRFVMLGPFLSWWLTAYLSLVTLQYLQINSFFSQSLSANRFQFLILVMLAYQAITFLFQSIGGHFTLNKKADPTDLPIYYSTSSWFLHFKIGSRFKNKIIMKAQEVLKSHLVLRNEMDLLKAQGLAVQYHLMNSVLGQEIAHLKVVDSQIASSRLTID